MNQHGTSPSDKNPEWEKLEQRMAAADAKAIPATPDKEQRVANASAKADKVVGELFAKLGVDRKVESSAAQVAAEPGNGNGIGQPVTASGAPLDLDLSGGNNPPPTQPPGGNGGQGSAGGGEPSWFDKLLAFLQSPTGKMFGAIMIGYFAIHWISATVTSSDRIAAMEKLAEINRKQKELDLKEKELNAKVQQETKAQETAPAIGCTAHRGNATAQMLQSCKTLTDIGVQGKGTPSRYTIQGNLERVTGEYELRDPRNPSQVLCQTYLPGGYRYSANGCAEEIRSLSYPADLNFFRYGNITYIFR